MTKLPIEVQFIYEIEKRYNKYYVKNSAIDRNIYNEKGNDSLVFKIINHHSMMENEK